MTRAAIAAALIAAWLSPTLAQPPVPPPPSNGGLVTHNGSLMAVEVGPDGRRVLIRYVDPRPAMRAFVVPGTVLVEGRWTAPGVFSGVSHSYWCGHAYPYAVTGGIELVTGGLVLQGPAPIIDPYSCAVLWYEWTGNSTLRFELYAQPPVTLQR